MLKKTLTYLNFDGQQISEEFYFHLSKTELTEMIMESDGEDLGARLNKIVESGNAKHIMSTFKDLILRSVGQRSADGKLFMKDKAARDAFLYSGAYDAFFMELVTNTGSATEFINGIMPKDLVEEIAKATQDGAVTVQLPAGDVEDKRPAWQRENRQPTDAELQKMTKAELAEAFKARL